jgi:hypothetical protein
VAVPCCRKTACRCRRRGGLSERQADRYGQRPASKSVSECNHVEWCSQRYERGESNFWASSTPEPSRAARGILEVLPCGCGTAKP